MALNKIYIDDDNTIPKNFTQGRLSRKYYEDNMEPFTDKLFIQNDYEVIEDLEKIILSWQRKHGFKLEVINFTVVEDPEEINRIVYENEVERSKGKKVDDSFNCINLKDSYTILLIVTYYIEVYNTEGINKDKQTKDIMKVLILVPRIVDQYFYYMKGNYYYATYQIVDGSIYNNSDKINPKSEMIAFKTGRPIRINRRIFTCKTLDGTELNHIIYTATIQNKHGSAMRYIFAKMGLRDGLAFMNIGQYILLTNSEPKCDENYYIIPCQNETYISVPKYIFNNDAIIQSAVGTIYRDVLPNNTYEEIFTSNFWILVLSRGSNLKVIPDINNGLSAINDLEQYYDIITREKLKLPEKDKATIYNVLFWMMKEFPVLRARDNTDMYYKRIRRSEYIASLYAAKLSTSVLNLANTKKNNLTIDMIKRRIYTPPHFLIKSMTKDTLICINNRVNDDDAFTALKASYKGISGVGENAKKAIADRYRNVSYSDAGIKDMTHSSATDPGMNTILCPLGTLEDNGYFYDYIEPNEWEKSFNTIISNFNELVNLKDAIIIDEQLIPHRNYYLDRHMVIESIEILKRLIEPFKTLDAIPAIKMIDETNLEESGTIIYIK